MNPETQSDSNQNLNAVALSLQEFETEISKGTLVIDTRDADIFELGFVPGAINIGAGNSFGTWMNALFEPDRRIVFVSEVNTENELLQHLKKYAFSNVGGFLSGGMETWTAAHKTIDMVISISPEEFALDKQWSENTRIIDVRKPSEWADGIVEGAELIMLIDLQEKIPEMKKDQEYEIYCGLGYRSMIACSILKKNGFMLVKNVYGGFKAIQDENISIIKPAL